MAHQHTDPACAQAHGELPAQPGVRTLVAVFASPVAVHLLHFGHDLGYRTVLVEPDLHRIEDVPRPEHLALASSVDPSFADGHADVVVTDHDRPELGALLDAALQTRARWIGVMGSPRHTAPHVAALRERGLDEAAVARVHRPIGLNIGSRTPAEIAVATLAGLIADRNDRPGGFTF
ncbi:xanthine dehydrogenase accessory factor [Catellatospora methionotrophica]|uniref:Xanthine dehydrogenase accessory factor n=1 Tax=Catellatospora methionotrophica TaxID=121620 RepID=A0A8J3PI62_9ACTN|nr:XdhC family protein [Catellatospora methionotrophica]GIG17088.1 xanthine dehydrogenase accessory factor [Catellatospora methionotrophica]